MHLPIFKVPCSVQVPLHKRTELVGELTSFPRTSLLLEKSNHPLFPLEYVTWKRPVLSPAIQLPSHCPSASCSTPAPLKDTTLNRNIQENKNLSQVPPTFSNSLAVVPSKNTRTIYINCFPCSVP